MNSAVARKEPSEEERDHQHCLICRHAETIRLRKKVQNPLLKLQEEHAIIINEIDLLLTTLKGHGRTQARSKKCVAKTTMHCVRLENLLSKHQMKEERVLVPIIAKYLDTDITAKTINEHRDMSSSLREIKNAITALELDTDYASLESVAKTVKKFEFLIREHFSREENVIFWFASLHISESDSI